MYVCVCLCVLSLGVVSGLCIVEVPTLWYSHLGQELEASQELSTSQESMVFHYLKDLAEHLHILDEERVFDLLVEHRTYRCCDLHMSPSREPLSLC